MSLTDEIDNLVKPEMRESWAENKFKWFVRDDSPEEMRCPGKFKSEYTTYTGAYIGISPKCYILQDESQTKLSAKGVPRSADLNYQMFVDGCYKGESKITRTFAQINYSRLTNSMVTRSVNKKCINSCYLKFFMHTNLNLLSPLKIDNKLL